MDLKELYGQAKHLQETKNYTEAMELYSEIINNYPNTQESYYSEIAMRDISDCIGFEYKDIRLIKENQNEMKQYKEKFSNIITTTTNSIEGFRIKKYIDVETTQVVIGTGIFSEFASGLQDTLGMRSSAFETKLQEAKQIAFKNLKEITIKKGGNAIVGISIECTSFTNNRIGLIVSGTIVKIENKDL